MQNQKYTQGKFRTIELFMLGVLMSDLLSPAPIAREEAAYHLGNMETSAAKAIPSLLVIAQDESQQLLLRVIAAEAVTKIDPTQTSVYLEVLIKALSSDDGPTLSVAVCDGEAVGKYAEPALPELFRLLGDDCVGVKADAAEAIWRITGDRGPAKRAAHELLRSQDWLDRNVGGGLIEVLEDERVS